jgi:hypothetical protein
VAGFGVLSPQMGAGSLDVPAMMCANKLYLSRPQRVHIVHRYPNTGQRCREDAWLHKGSNFTFEAP